MTETAARLTIDEAVALADRARALAARHRELDRGTNVGARVEELTRLSSTVEDAQRHLAAMPSDDATLPRAAEWFLDNYYLLRRIARQVVEELPPGFILHLPQVATGPSAGCLRIDLLARELIAATSIELDATTLRCFVDAYQAAEPLTIAELWALPTMLRTSVLHHLVRFLGELHISRREDGVRPEHPTSAEDRIALDPGVGVERSIRVLRVLDVIDWKKFFEQTSRVEAILAKDPADVYTRMDFETSDSYRRAVEALAWGTPYAEHEVAEVAVALAIERDDVGRHRHVGHYLVGGGRPILEQRLGYRATGVARIRQALMRRPTVSYLVPLALLTLIPLAALGCFLAAAAVTPVMIAVTIVVAAIPVSVVAVAIIHAVLSRVLVPRTLPKLDFTEGMTADVRTLVVIPTLIGQSEDIPAMIRQLELHYLANPDPQLQFALLTDEVDSKTAPTDAMLIDCMAREIEALNVKHGENGGSFHLLHRESRWNPGEERFMGWERKRGKLEELNRLLRGDTKTSFTRRVGDPDGLVGIRFVITLDSDTQLPMGSAHRLVGTLAHPLNLAEVDVAGRVAAGYTIVQPRIETSPSSARPTWFSRIFAGDVGFDIYSHAVSELYQDLFGSGIYCGKGIYDIDAFAASVEGRAPENTIVSHDLFEGVHGRAALASDIVLYESYPSTYAAFAKRMHRWVRGDWQLLPWLFPRVPSLAGRRMSNTLAGIDRWKIFDNLRRSVTSPATILLLVLGWTWLPGSALWWTVGVLSLVLAPHVPSVIGDRHTRVVRLERCGLALVFLAHEAAVVVDALVRVIVRTTFTRKHLLEWTTAANVELAAARTSPRALYWWTLAWSPIVAIGIAGIVAWARPSAVVAAAPLLALWCLAPEIARAVSRPRRPHDEPLRADERKHLRLLARRTWRFFDAFVGPVDQWLPIDNYQAEPYEQTAHRTSPTNIGLMLLATLSAYDFGYLGPSELSLRIRRTFESITRLQHYRGHLLNWYDTRTLQPLLPAYVSTVDSGNLAGCLVALGQGCRDVAGSPVVRAEAWQGLADSVDLLGEVVDSIPHRTAGSLRSVVDHLHAAIENGRHHPSDAYPILRTLSEETALELDREVLAFLECGAHRHDADLLHALRESIDRLHHQLRQMRRELDTLLPWLALVDEPAWAAVDLPTQLRLDEIVATALQLGNDLESWRSDQRAHEQLTPELDASAGRIADALLHASGSAATLHAELLALADRVDEEVRRMDFRLLFDGERKLFHIGYNVTADHIDPNYYDLLASEARLASYLAIVKRDVPETHWYALGRPMTTVAGTPALLSWGGTMFEYLMPNLLMRSREGTLLARTGELAVAAQVAWAEQHDEPWGVSESAFARRDASQTYQYRSFGVPGLGFKRGLDEDRVITPYASALAVSIRPRAVAANLAALETLGMRGSYGLFEALDFTPERATDGRPFTIVRSYMAHHQGMLLVALGNLLNDRSMVDRFHADPVIAMGEILLDERAPNVASTEWPYDSLPDSDAPEPSIPEAPPPWPAPEPSRRQAFVVGNGRLASLVTDSGGGGLTWHDLAVTRYEPDSTHDDNGLWIYLRDEASHRVWLATSPQARTTYAMHKIELHRRHEGISVHVGVVVAAVDDVEIREITLHNETDEPRRLTVTSAGRPVLVGTNEAPVHPAFSSMFVESEHLADLDAVMFARRPKSKKEAPAVLVHRLVHDGPPVTFAGYETDRLAFHGRCADVHAPAALVTERGPLHGRVGAVLDPIMSLMATVELEPKGIVKLAFITTIARSRTSAVALARRYGSMLAIRWAVRDAELEAPRRLQRTNVEPPLVPAIQRLLSGLLFADPSLRGTFDGHNTPRPCKRRLWGRGISGDDPIVLVRVHDSNAPLLREVLAAQRYLRSVGVRFDLVLIDEQVSGYASASSGTLQRVLAQHDDHDWLGRHGGIYALVADQVLEEERQLLEATARVVLDTRSGSLASRLNRVVELRANLPRFEATLASGATVPAASRPELTFDNGIGGFTGDGREYVIAIPAGGVTPAPWCNVLANEQFGCMVSESSLGATWSLNSGENKLTPWRNDPVLDAPSEVLYLRDEETAAVWSPTPLPAGRESATIVRHGAGYTTYERRGHGLDQVMTVFVPPSSPLKIVWLRVKNRLARHRRLTATYYAEWVLGARRENQTPFIVSECDRDTGALLATCSWNTEMADRVAFLASNEKLHGFTSDRTEFLGARGDYARPDGLERWGLSGSLEIGIDPCAALQVHLELDPGEEREVHFILGQAAGRDEARTLITRFQNPVVVDAAWTELGEFWDELLGNVTVQTPEPAMDLMLNRWLLYQSVSSRLFGRIGFYQASGAFGFRDQLQDVLALVHAAPERTRAHILEAAAHQFEQGDVLHWWHPPFGRGVRTRCSDDLLWLPFVTAEYVAATGDAAILEVPVPFLTAEPLAPDEHDRFARYEPTTSAPLLEHCRRALEHGATEGVHGLPLMGDGDWNDGMNLIGAAGRGESVWLGWFLCAAMDRFGALYARIGDAASATMWTRRADALRATIKSCAWDGAWYLRAFHDDGSLVGSATSRECQIDSIAQSWGVLSSGDHQPDERDRLAVQAADERLVRDADRLVLLFWPPFDSRRHDPGYVRAYPPGIRENGGQYTHAATWLGWAHAALGDGGRAAHIFRLLNPILHARTAAESSHYRVEPYALAADIYSCPPWVGRGGWTWYTGSAAWMWRLGVEAILGLHRSDGDLRIEPCIPPSWPGFEAWVHLGRQRIHVVVENPEHLSSGVATMTLDGAAVDSNRVRLDPDIAGTHEVRVRLGLHALGSVVTHTA